MWAWTLEAIGTALPFGGGTGCPAETAQVLRVTWDGGISKPGGDDVNDVERGLYEVTVLRAGGAEARVTPYAIADLGDGDNNHKLCLDTADRVLSVFFPADHVTDPKEDLNAATTITVSM